VAATKYGHLVKKLEFRSSPLGGANARELTFVGGDDLQGFDLNFIIGVYDQPGDWAPGRGAHTHPFDELLLFFGYDDKDLGYLGAEMSLALGPELEVHRFNVPTVVAAPSNLPHCPLITEKVYKPFGHFHLALSGRYAVGMVEEGGQTDGHKYDHLVRTMKVSQGPDGAGPAQEIVVSGDDLEGVNINFKLGLYNKTGPWNPGQGAHSHPYDEVIVFFGHNTDDLSYLGAELTVALGAEQEKHTIDAPTVIVLPKGVPHYPVTCNRVERPYGVMKVGLAARYESTRLD
jgi:hypothetical protein